MFDEKELKEIKKGKNKWAEETVKKLLVDFREKENLQRDLI